MLYNGPHPAVSDWIQILFHKFKNHMHMKSVKKWIVEKKKKKLQKKFREITIIKEDDNNNSAIEHFSCCRKQEEESNQNLATICKIHYWLV